MRHRRLEGLIEDLYDTVDALPEGGDREKIITEIINLEKLRGSLYDADCTRECEERRYKLDKAEHIGKIAIAFLGLVATVAVAVATNRAEEFRALTSKVDQKTKDVIRFIRY